MLWWLSLALIQLKESVSAYKERQLQDGINAGNY